MKRFLEILPRLLLSMLLLAAISGGLSAQGLDAPPMPGLEEGPPGLENLGDGFGEELSKGPLSVQAFITPPDGKTPAYLFVTVELDPGWHIYSMTQKGEGPIPTKIKVSPSPTIKKIGAFLVSPPPKKIMDPGFGIEVENHYDTVTWFAPLELAPDTDPKTLELKGSVYAQACDQGCRPPEDYPFTAKPAADPAKYAKLIAAAASPESAAEQGFNIESIKVTDDATEKGKTLWWYIGLGFLGGLILNVMPCVLPVIGLKILSFMEQAGQSRSRAFVLNLWYSLGLMSVFVLLATLAVVFGFGWGELFRYGGMNLAMTAVVFVMALSFLGTWEVPIPGFIGSGKAEAASHKEGAIGAFMKGVLTTILATPCSAPFLASAITWAFAQPPGHVFAIFVSIGVGMASPYLLIGAWPALIKFLPKPGAWMETFKQVMGFVLLATVIFLLASTEKDRLLPTITFLFGLWASCWWIGKISVLAPTRIKLLHWGEAIAFAVLIWMFAFLWLGAKAEYELPWKPYTTARFEQLMDEKKTVMVDFTADWCATCKTFEALILNTEDVYKAVKKDDVVTLKGDWTHREKSKEVNNMLQRLGAKQVPVILIIPDGDLNRKSIFIGSYTKSDILDALKK